MAAPACGAIPSPGHRAPGPGRAEPRAHEGVELGHPGDPGADHPRVDPRRHRDERLDHRRARRVPVHLGGEGLPHPQESGRRATSGRARRAGPCRPAEGGARAERPPMAAPAAAADGRPPSAKTSSVVEAAPRSRPSRRPSVPSAAARGGDLDEQEGVSAEAVPGGQRLADEARLHRARPGRGPWRTIRGRSGPSARGARTERPRSPRRPPCRARRSAGRPAQRPASWSSREAGRPPRARPTPGAAGIGSLRSSVARHTADVRSGGGP